MKIASGKRWTPTNSWSARQHRLTVLITGASDMTNKGTVSILAGAVDALRELMPESRFVVLAFSNPTNYQEAWPSDVLFLEYVPSIYHYGTLLIRSILWGAIQRIGLETTALSRSPCINAYRTADVVIDLSGDSFSGDYGARIVAVHGFQMIIPKLFKKPLVMYCQSIGPFHGIAKHFAKLCLLLADLIIAREPITLDMLKELRIESYLCADPAFLLKAEDSSTASHILSEYSIDLSKPIIGVNVSQHIDALSGSDFSGNKYRTMMAQLIDYLVSSHDAQIIVVPHVVESKRTVSYDDLYVARKVVNLVRQKDRVAILTDNYSPSMLRAIIGHCDIFVGARMHANISALSMCVPTVAIAYSHKTWGIMGMLEQSAFVVDSNSMSLEQLKAKVDTAWNERKEVRSELQSSLVKTINDALRAARLVRRLLEIRGILSESGHDN